MQTQTEAGQVKWFDPKKGYGFVTCDNGDVLLHAKVLRDSGFPPSVDPGMYIECEVERQAKGTRAMKVITVRPDLPIEKRMELQNVEFDACRALSDAVTDHDRIPVVDDAYPEFRNRYESALRTFLRACKANGRTL